MRSCSTILLWLVLPYVAVGPCLAATHPACTTAYPHGQVRYAPVGEPADAVSCGRVGCTATCPTREPCASPPCEPSCAPPIPPPQRVLVQQPPQGALSFGGGAVTLPLPSIQLPCFFRSPAVRQILTAGEEQASWSVAEAAASQTFVPTAMVSAATAPPNLLATPAAESFSDPELLLLLKLLAALRQSPTGGTRAASELSEPSCSDRGSAATSSAQSSGPWQAPSGVAQRIEELERELQEMHHDLDQLLKLLEERLRQQPPQSRLRLDEVFSAPAHNSRLDRQVRTTSGHSISQATAVQTTLWTPESAGGPSAQGPYHRGITLLPPVEPAGAR